jgi:hypothetical protein
MSEQVLRFEHAVKRAALGQPFRAICRNNCSKMPGEATRHFVNNLLCICTTIILERRTLLSPSRSPRSCCASSNLPVGIRFSKNRPRGAVAGHRKHDLYGCYRDAGRYRGYCGRLKNPVAKRCCRTARL